MDNCTFKSSEEVKIFNNDNNNASTTPLSAFAIVKFSNHLDVDILIKKYNKYIPNIFNNNTSVPLFLNKYLNRKERFVPPSSSSSSSSSSTTAATSMSSMSTSNNGNNSKSNDNCNLIIVENLLNFKPQPYFTRMDFERFINKFKNFGNVIDSIYFPLVDKGVNLDDIKIFDYGYIRFKQPNPNLMENTLRILYYLNGLSWEEFINLDVNNLPPLLSIITEENTDKEEEEEKEEDTEEKAEEGEEKKTEGSEETNNRKLSITIAQHKHNHNLFAQANSFYLSLSKNSSLGVSFPNPMFTINQFSRNLNYQETNIYVNNLPIVFNNDDVTWEKFWGQFGKIKSAKIIKPQFYHENEDENKSGKIGFVFYQTFKMAIGAILMTNNKVVNVDHFNPIIIQSSFAIQKSNTNKDLKPHLSQQQHQQLQQQQQQSQNPHQQSHVHHPHQQIPNHQVNGNNSVSASTAAAAAAAAVAAAATASNQPYYTYQPMIPYYYGYHPNPYQFTNGIHGPPPPSGSANHMGVSGNNSNGNGGNDGKGSQNIGYSNYLIPARAYPYYYYDAHTAASAAGTANGSSGGHNEKTRKE
ncbi:hypothetical protein SBY92_003766 [Candida maltosa Xu316]